MDNVHRLGMGHARHFASCMLQVLHSFVVLRSVLC